MSEPVRIDSHVHIYQSAEEGIAAKEGYEIWEYGRQEVVAISDVPGTVDDLLRSMAKAAMDKVVIVNLYVADERRSNLRKALPPNPGPSERERAERELARLIQDIGTDRVMMGSDFPWYDLDQTVDRVMTLPLLSMEEKEGIIGASRV